MKNYTNYTNYKVLCGHTKTIEKRKPSSGNSYSVKNGIYMEYVTDNEQMFKKIILPKCLTGQVMKLVHDKLGHNGSTLTCIIPHRFYY